MTDAPFADSKPRAGTRGEYRAGDDAFGFEVVRVEDSLCWARYDTDSSIVQPFIWRFKDGLNCYHDWPGKAPSALKEKAS